jgi:hypothetical protein
VRTKTKAPEASMGILVYPRKEAPGKWMVMWRTPEGRRYRNFNPDVGELLRLGPPAAAPIDVEPASPLHPHGSRVQVSEGLRAATKGATSPGPCGPEGLPDQASSPA